MVVDATTTSLLPQLHDGLLDLAVVALPIHDPDLETEPLFSEDLVLVTPPDHPLGARATVDHGRAGRPRRSCSAPRAPRSATTSTPSPPREGLELQPKAEIDGMRLLASLAFEGFGAAVLPASAVPRWYPGDFRTRGRRGRRRAGPSASPAAAGACRRRRPGRSARCSSRWSHEQAPLQPGCHLPAS